MSTGQMRIRERRRLREIRRDLPNVGDWAPERRAEVEQQLRRIMLLGVAGPTSHPDFRLSWEAVELFVELESLSQAIELHAGWMAQVSVTVRTFDPVTGETISERLVRPEVVDAPSTAN